jgi:HK97 family phage major capsid protein
MAPTINELIETTEQRKRAYERAIGDAKAAMKQLGQLEATGENRKAYQELLAEQRVAVDSIKGVEAELERLRAAKAEDDEADKLAAERKPTSAARTNDSRTVSVGDGSSTMLYGAGSNGDKPWTRDDGRPAVLERGQRFADHEVARDQIARDAGRDHAIVSTHGNIGQMVRSMTTTTGVAIVPTIWSSDIIDRARNYAAVFNAGAQVVPMDRKVLQLGRLTVDPVASFRAEGSTITATDPTLDNVTLTAKSVNCLVVGSMEWFQDSSPSAGEVVSNAIAKAMALQIDLVCLFGGVTTGVEQGAVGNNLLPTGGLPNPPNPTGILANLLANAPSSVLGGATNGTVPVSTAPWNEVINTIMTPMDFNEAPNALLWPTHLARKYAETYDTLNQPLRQPDVVQGIQKYVTNQIPSGMTQGTGTLMSDLFVGDFRQLLVGMRMDISVQFLTERYAELGQLALLATARVDVALARPRAFCVYRFLQGV